MKLEPVDSEHHGLDCLCRKCAKKHGGKLSYRPIRDLHKENARRKITGENLLECSCDVCERHREEKEYVERTGILWQSTFYDEDFMNGEWPKKQFFQTPEECFCIETLYCVFPDEFHFKITKPNVNPGDHTEKEIIIQGVHRCDHCGQVWKLNTTAVVRKE